MSPTDIAELRLTIDMLRTAKGPIQLNPGVVERTLGHLLDTAERCARLEALLRECVAPLDECPTACLLLETRKGRDLRDRISKEIDK